MIPGSWTTQYSSYIYPPVDFTEENKLVGTQDPVWRSDASSDKAFIPPKVPTWPLVPLFAKDFFIKFMKIFIKTTQAYAQILAEP